MARSSFKTAKRRGQSPAVLKLLLGRGRMRINILVKPNARKELIEKLPDGSLRVSVNEPAQEGRANEAVIRMLAKHFGVTKSAIRIAAGTRGKRKIVEVAE